MLLNPLLFCILSIILAVNSKCLQFPKYETYALINYSGFVSIICSGAILFLSFAKIQNLEFIQKLAFVGWGVFLASNHILSLFPFIRSFAMVSTFIGIVALIAGVMNFYCDEITCITGSYTIMYLLFTIFRFKSAITFIISICVSSFALYVLTHVKKQMSYMITKVSITGITGVYFVNSFIPGIFHSFYDMGTKPAKILFFVGLIVWILTIVTSVLIEFFFDDVKKKAAEIALKNKAKV